MKLTCAIALSFVFACGNQEKAEPAKAPLVVEEPQSTEVAELCDDGKTEAMVQGIEEALVGYSGLDFPKADAECEALRLFAVKLGPPAQQFFSRMTAFRERNQTLSEQCRASNKEKYGTQLAETMKKLEDSLGPRMTAFEEGARACKDHPGMWEAFDGASFPAKK